MSTSDSETEVFARRLRELREASGHSYGTLARRVGVSASTLHRYCSGHIVPLEFSPVERLARLCGCRGDDLVALHRLWVLADGERRRRQASGVAGAQERSTAGKPDPEPEPEPGTEPEAEPGHDAAPAPDPKEKPPSPQRRRVARAAGLVAAATVLTLLALPPFELAPSSLEGRGGPEHLPTPRYAGAAAPSAFVAGPTPGPSAKPRASASGRPTGASDSGGPSRTGSRTAPSGSAGAAKSRSGVLPFTWNVDDHLWTGGCNHSYVIDRPPSAVPPPPSASDAEPWARSLGAVHGGDTLIRLTLQGRSEQAVVIQALRVRVAAERPPHRGNVYGMGMGCGGTMTPRLFDVDLDAARPTARSVPGNDSGAEIPAVSLPYRISIRDPEVLMVTGRTVRCDCDWYLELEWSTSDRSGTVRIDDGGAPFRTSGIEGRPAHLYDTGLRRWFTLPDENAPAAPAAPEAPHPPAPTSPDSP
ncbi:helix-turn-helix domain-containing protein [Streptomyces sp. NPDC020412]|uniref:helix-turn-helix domain-containing protein n=1 Tax=Streptomyces sp. NPDC020412 TaxID=3365073 RepID=UPI0037BC0CDE